MRKRILAALLTAVLLLGGCSAGRKAGGTDSGDSAASGKADSAGEDGASSGKTLKLYFFSAGKADAILLYSAHAAVLIDTGERGFGKEIAAYLNEKGIHTLDALIITHFDQDHVGGAAKVLKSVAVKRVYQSDCPKDSKEYAKYEAVLAETGISPVTVRSAVTLTLDGLSLTIDPPRQTSYDTDPSNNSSLIVSAQYGEKRFLFAGDAEDARLSEFLAEDNGTYDLLKVPYHGRWQKKLTALIDAVSPAVAVITSSDDQTEDAETVSALKRAGAKVFLTRKAAVLAVCDGKSLRTAYENP